MKIRVKILTTCALTLAITTISFAGQIIFKFEHVKTDSQQTDAKVYLNVHARRNTMPLHQAETNAPGLLPGKTSQDTVSSIFSKPTGDYSFVYTCTTGTHSAVFKRGYHVNGQHTVIRVQATCVVDSKGNVSIPPYSTGFIEE